MCSARGWRIKAVVKNQRLKREFKYTVFEVNTKTSQEKRYDFNYSKLTSKEGSCKCNGGVDAFIARA